MNGEAVCFVPDGEALFNDTLDSGAGVPITVDGVTVARMIRCEIPKDPYDPREHSTMNQIKKYTAEIVIKTGTMLIPFGETYKNLVKYYSCRNGENAHELLLSIFTNTVTFYFPWVAPMFTVVKDLYKKFVALF